MQGRAASRNLSMAALARPRSGVSRPPRDLSAKANRVRIVRLLVARCEVALLRSPDGGPARGRAAADPQGRRLRARPRRRGRLQAAELDDGADVHRGARRRARRAEGEDGGRARDPSRRGDERCRARHGRVGGAAEGRRRARPAGLLAAAPSALGEELTLVKREWATEVGPGRPHVQGRGRRVGRGRDQAHRDDRGG